ncbi:hypothetical protein [Falsiroseomonas sp. E2-1-a20]|uniref:hypothetical protein n=1 Tax=Falsiroseomonas sp. E2-1-a20 TaxID=3239300 RepID=UPI003F3E17F0
MPQFLSWLSKFFRRSANQKRAVSRQEPIVAHAAPVSAQASTPHTAGIEAGHAETLTPAAPAAVAETPQQQVRQLIKQALEAPTPDQFIDFIVFTKSFRRMGVWNARMAYIQRPGASVIATEVEWTSVGRHVLPDAVPIIILWPFSPIRYVYEDADTGPPVDRAAIGDPFAATGVFAPGMLNRLVRELDKHKTFKVKVEFRRQGFSYAGSGCGTIHPTRIVWGEPWTSRSGQDWGFCIGEFGGLRIADRRCARLSRHAE